MNSHIYINGAKYDLGPVPQALIYCGFKSREEVTRVAAKFSQGTPYMSLTDVAEYLDRKRYE